MQEGKGLGLAAVLLTASMLALTSFPYSKAPAAPVGPLTLNTTILAARALEGGSPGPGTSQEQLDQAADLGVAFAFALTLALALAFAAASTVGAAC